MISHKARLAKLEKKSPPAPQINPDLTDEMYNRAIDTLAAALGKILPTATTEPRTSGDKKRLEPLVAEIARRIEFTQETTA